MEKINLEKWQMEEIGKLMIKAGSISLAENDRHRLFIEISHIASCFGFYETAEKMIREKIEEFIPKYKMAYYNIGFNGDGLVNYFEATVALCENGKSLEEIHAHIVNDIERERRFSTNRRHGRGKFYWKWIKEGGD